MTRIQIDFYVTMFGIKDQIDKRHNLLKIRVSSLYIMNMIDHYKQSKGDNIMTYSIDLGIIADRHCEIDANTAANIALNMEYFDRGLVEIIDKLLYMTTIINDIPDIYFKKEWIAALNKVIITCHELDKVIDSTYLRPWCKKERSDNRKTDSCVLKSLTDEASTRTE